MKNRITFLCVLAFSLLAGYLLSTISFTGRLGISLFYKQYRFMKVWWKDFLLVFAFWLLIWGIQVLLRNAINKSATTKMHFIFFLVALVGLIYSYWDFRNTLSHRWLGEPFHAGVYLFWIGWMALTVFVWIQPQKLPDLEENMPAINSGV